MSGEVFASPDLYVQSDDHTGTRILVAMRNQVICLPGTWVNNTALLQAENVSRAIESLCAWSPGISERISILPDLRGALRKEDHHQLPDCSEKYRNPSILMRDRRGLMDLGATSELAQEPLTQ